MVHNCCASRSLILKVVFNMTQNDIEKLQQELQLAKQELRDFIYIVSHDVKAPARNIKAFSQRLREKASEKLTDKESQYLNFIENGADEMSILLDGVTEYSRIISLEEVDSEIDVNDVIKLISIEISEFMRMSSAKVTIKSDLPRIIAKPKLIHKLFKNLIINAIIFNDNIPEVIIDYKSEKNGLVFSIKDNGIGIAKENFDKIFKIFRRLHEKEFAPGIGLGLALCKRIMNIHNGEIFLESDVDKGSIFYISI